MLVFQDFQESLQSQIVSRELRPDIAKGFVRGAQVFGDERNHVFVFHAFAQDLADGDGESLFMRVARMD